MDEEYNRTDENGRGNPEQTRQFWRHIYGNEAGFLCLASANRNDNELTGLRHTFHPYPTQAKAAATHALKESERGREVYHTAHLVKEGTERKKENAARVHSLWADLDGASVPEDPKPTAMVESSPGRWHVYWRLSKPIDQDRAEELNKRLTYAIGADKSKWALTTLLRPPQTTNYKRHEPFGVTLSSLDAHRQYDPDELDRLLPPLASANGHTKKSYAADVPPVCLGPSDLRVWQGEQAVYKKTGEVDRSKSLYKIGAVLAKARASRRVIVEALKERDESLGWNKYADRADYAKQYTNIAEKVASDDATGNVEDPPQSLPLIVVNDRPLRDVGDEALQALETRNTPPTLFARSGKIIRLGQDENDAPIIQEAGEGVVRHHLTRSANFVHERETRRSTESWHVHPPKEVVADVMSVPHLPFPPLIGVPRTPFFRPDGTIVHKPGYDSPTRLYYVPAHKGFTITVPDKPTAEDLTAAVELLDEAVGDLPYVDKASAANTLALLLTPLLRNIISGPAPIALIDKPTPGTGGSLLAEVVSSIATGSPAGMMSAPRDDEEVRKQITSALIRGSLVITLDNIDGVLYAPSLSRALTSEYWEDRILGRSEIIRVPQRATWMASGNNLQVGGDLPRRGYWIRLDARTERPWERGGFRHPNLKSWVGENRARLVSALLTMGRAWFTEGKPEGSSAIGSFEGWSRTLGGVLEVAGVSGFLGNLSEMYERAADGTNEWAAFLEAWRKFYGEEAHTTKLVAADLHDEEKAWLREALPDEFGTIIPEHPDKGLSRKLGKAFAKREGRRHGTEGVHLVRAGSTRNATRWAVRTAPEGPGERVTLVTLVSLSNPSRARARERDIEGKSTNQTNKVTPSPDTSSDKEAGRGLVREERRRYHPVDGPDGGGEGVTPGSNPQEAGVTPSATPTSTARDDDPPTGGDPVTSDTPSVAEVVEILRRPRSGPRINHPLYLRGKTTLEILANSVLRAMHRDTATWESVAAVVDEAARAHHPIECECEECL